MEIFDTQSLIKQINLKFDSAIVTFFLNPIYKLENKYFKNTILEAYNVYIKYDGIYIMFKLPNNNYICEKDYNFEEQILIYGSNKLNFLFCSFEDMLDSLKKLIIKYGNYFKTNRNGEIIEFPYKFTKYAWDILGYRSLPNSKVKVGWCLKFHDIYPINEEYCIEKHDCTEKWW